MEKEGYKSKLTSNQKKELFTLFGIGVLFFTAAFLEFDRFLDSFSINGESVYKINSLSYVDILDRIKLAISEGRNEDAKNLKKILDLKEMK